MRKILVLFTLLISFLAKAQELNCTVVVNAQQTGNENVQIFKTLENQLNEFVNNTKWTNKNFSIQERINCNMVINITDYSSDVFVGSVQVGSSRTVFNSTYQTPVYNFNDRDFSFRYLEFQALNYSPNQFESNLVSVLAFHVYMILGMDADTYKEKGGDQYYEQARAIVGYSVQNSVKGWEPPKGGDQTRSALIDNVLSPTYKEFRSVMYQYHRHGLDIMNGDVKKGKMGIANALGRIGVMHNRRPNSFIQRVFFDAKGEEIEDIFSGGPSVNITQLIETLNKVAPSHSSKWRNIKF